MNWTELQPILIDPALGIAVLIMANGVIMNALYSYQLFLAYRSLRKRVVPSTPLVAWWRINAETIPISILVPAYCEEATIVESVRSLLNIYYPEFEVIVVNDGSTDGTLEVLIRDFELELTPRAYDKALDHKPIGSIYRSKRYNHLVVIDKVNGGKADALNAGINLARSPLFCAIDADSILEADALLRAVEPFLNASDKVVAVGGTIRIANGNTIHNGRITKIALPENLLSLFQIVEYLRAFLMARLAWSEMGALMLISGAFGIFKRSVAINVGGYSKNTVGEDMEIIVKIHRHMREKNLPYQIRFVPEPVCWTEVPEDLKVLGLQRQRWQRGSLETFFKHWTMLGRPRYGRYISLGLVFIMISDIFSPPLEAIGYILMPVFFWVGIIDWQFFVAYLALSFVYGVFISVGSLVLEEIELKRFSQPSDLFVLMLAAIVENFGYRQLNNMWRVIGWWEFLRGNQSWGKMTRKGFSN